MFQSEVSLVEWYRVSARLGVALTIAAILSACTFEKAEVGSEKNPIKLFFVPSVDAKVVGANSKIMKEWLEAHSPYKFEVRLPQSYVAVVEAFGSKAVDVVALNTAGYLIAHEKYGAEARATVVRSGETTYRAQIVVRKGAIKNVSELNGKKFAFVDPASLSGYILPMKLLKDAGVKVGETIFAMKHDNVISMVYQGQVDAGATFYSPPLAGEGIQDARRLVKTQYPDIEDKVEILKLTEGVPNDPIVFRKDLPEKIKTDVIDAFKRMLQDEKGKEAFKAIYAVTEIRPATDADYNGVREMLKSINVKTEDLLKK